MKKNVSFLVLMFLLFLSPQVIFAQTGVDPDPVQSAKNRAKFAEEEKARAAAEAKRKEAQYNNKTAPVTVSGSPVVVATPPSNPSKRKFIDPANMDLSVKPGDNFYLYANGTWIKKTPIPASKTRWGSFDALAEESSLALKGLLEDASKNAGKNELMKRVGDYYASAMDSAAILKPVLLNSVQQCHLNMV